VWDAVYGESVELLNSLPIYETPEERERRHEIGKFFQETFPPTTPVRNPAEWEKMKGVLIRRNPLFSKCCC